MGNLFSSRIPHIHILPQSAMILLVVWGAKGDGSARTSKASSKVCLLNDDTLLMGLCNCNESAFGQIDQGAH